MKTIEDKVIKTEKVSWRSFEFLQKNTFKDFDKTQLSKLKTSIINNDFCETFKVYEEKGKVYCLDGFHRCLALESLKADGYAVPEEFTASFIQCKNKQDAAKKVLVYSSQYAHITNEGLYEFSFDYNLDYEDIKLEIDIPSLDMDRYEAGYVGSGQPGAEDGEDDVPEPPKEPKAKYGDLYLLGGRHRLLCGDATKPEDVEKLMDGNKAVLMNTDPPYGIDFVKTSQEKGQSTKYEDIANDDLTEGKELQDFLEQVIRLAVPHLVDNCPFYLWHPMLTQGTFFAAAAAAAAAADILINRQIVWVKPSFVFGRGDYHWKHELCFYGWRRGHMPNFYGERNQSTVWEIGRENDNIHPTQKPVELFKRPILNHTKSNEVVYEPFSGSGSQLIAAEQTNRDCFALELNPSYIDVILERFTNLTGKEVELIDRIED